MYLSLVSCEIILLILIIEIRPKLPPCNITDYQCMNIILLRGGCGPVHKPFTYHAGAPRSFPGGDNTTPQKAKQTPNKGCAIVHQKWRLQVDIHEPQSLVPRLLVRLTISHTNDSNGRLTSSLVH